MAKLFLVRPMFRKGTLSADFGAAAVTAQSADFANLRALGTDEFFRIVFDPDSATPEVVDFTSHAAASTSMSCSAVADDRGREQYAGASAARLHQSGAKWRLVLTAGMVNLDSFVAVRASSDVALAASTAWKDVDATLLRGTLRGVEPGHLVWVSAAFQWSAEAVAAFGDVASIVSGVAVNGWAQQGAEGGSNFGLPALRGNASEIRGVGGGASKAVVTGDLPSASNDLTLGLRARQDAATARTISSAATTPIILTARNLGFRVRP